MQLNEMTPQSACEEIEELVRNVYQKFVESLISKEHALAELSFLRTDLDMRDSMLDQTAEDAKLFIATKLFIKLVAHQITQQDV